MISTIPNYTEADRTRVKSLMDNLGFKEVLRFYGRSAIVGCRFFETTVHGVIITDYDDEIDYACQGNYLIACSETTRKKVMFYSGLPEKIIIDILNDLNTPKK